MDLDAARTSSYDESAYRMDNGQPENSANVNRHLFRSTEEVKRQLKRLALLVADDGDFRAEIFEEIREAAQALKTQKCLKTGSIGEYFPKSLDSIPVPECFLCPISSELMRDPVILATGQTYDRAYIQAWLDDGHRTCPKTQQILPHVTLTPNYLVRTMIEHWCEWQGLEAPLRSVASANGNGLAARERSYAAKLVDKLSGDHQSQQRREAARELRVLTRKNASYRTYLAQEAEAVSALIPLLLSPDSESQEHAVTTLLNLSIEESNKRVIAEEGAVAPIVEVLRCGSMPARENAAAALFSLSAVEENKVVIGASGAIPRLLELLCQGTYRGKKDAASALFNLCISQGNRGKCVRAGVVPILLKLIKDGDDMADGSLAVLAIVAGNAEGARAIGDAGALPLLMQFMKDGSPRNQENAVLIVFAVCSRDSSFLNKVKSMDGGEGYMTLVDLSTRGTSRARRKAEALLSRINKL